MDGFNNLIFWYLNHKRDLPWRATSDPYKVWLSEIILQQTRVAQGLPYYLRFVNTFPDVFALAEAPAPKVMKLWQGLGYYSRARNMHHTAKYVAEELGGTFPNSYKDLKNLKGVGPYTAAAIASIAFGLPHAVVDGNTARVLARVFDVAVAVNSTKGSKEIDRLADEVLDPDRPDLHNQAMMELGATVCLPKKPLCTDCPLEGACLARKRGTQDLRPVKIPKKKPLTRYMDYVVLEDFETVVFRRRQSNDIWRGLNDFPALEGKAMPSPEELADFVQRLFPECRIDSVAATPALSMTHMLTHRRIEARFWKFGLSSPVNNNSVYFTVNKTDIPHVAVPRPVEHYLEVAEWV